MLKTSLKSLALVAALFGTGQLMAQACNTNAWGVDLSPGAGTSGSVVAGSPTGVPPVSRYSGRCGLLSDTAGEFVSDGSPLNEPTYIARFYVRPAVTSGTAVVFQALEDLQGTPSIQVSQTGNQLAFAARGATGGTPVSIVAGAWYSVEVNWTAGGSMTYNVRGNNAASASTGTLTGVAAGAQVDQANLGWISGGSGGSITTDAFESRRTQPIGRLCQGDANASNSITSADRFAITQEIGGTLATGQPDCNESGSITSADRFCVTQLIGAGATCL